MLSETVKTWPEQWMAKGREEVQAQTAIKMLSKGISMELISEITGLTREQIEKLTADKNRIAESATPYKTIKKPKIQRKATKPQE